MDQIPLFAGILQAPETSSKPSRCLHTAEAAGSNPASPTSTMLRSAGKNAERNAKPQVCLGPLCSNVDEVTLSGSSTFRTYSLPLCIHVVKRKTSVVKRSVPV